MLTKKIRRIWPFLLFAVIFIFVFRKVFFSGHVPFPGDLLVSWFFPYKAGGWEGFSEWITHKEFILADVVRQLYPWRVLSVDLLKSGVLPLWNVYSFAGTPLMANVQSAVFYPFNILFFLIGGRWAWIISIMIQPLLAFLFMFLFMRSLKISRVSATFSSIGFAFIGYIMVWFEMGIIGHAALWLPLILWGITKYIKIKSAIFLVLSALGMTFSIFAGHAQTAMYVLLFSVAYFIVMGKGKLSTRQLAIGLIVLFLGISLAAIQIVPALELMALSPRDKISSTRTFHAFITPPSHIAMLFAPDFFGNPASGNFWGKTYGEFMSYSGIVLLMCALIGFVTNFRKRLIKLSFFTVIIAFLVAYVPFVAELIFQSHIPILSTGLPSRTIFLAGVGFVIASAYGVEALQKNSRKSENRRIIISVIIFLSVYVLLWTLTFIMPIESANAAIARRNLILPTGIAFLSALLIMGRKYFKHAFLLWIIMFACMGGEYAYFMNKYLPWSPSHYMFPSHELINELKKMSGVNRIYGYGTARVDTNLFVQWRLQSPEGYDPLYIRRYAEFMRAGTTGKLETDLPRSDALLPDSTPNKDTYKKQVLLNVLGVRYVLDKDDFAPKKWNPRTDVFRTERFKLIYQEYKWKIYENTQALPRAAVFYDYAVIKNKDTAIQTLFDKKFPYRKKLITESAPNFSAQPSSITPAEITSYSANSVTIRTETKKPGLLFLSDNYYPGWKAYVDGKQVGIILADYTFRAVEISRGKHTIRFSYEPMSVFIGGAISLISLALLFSLRKKKVA